MGIIGIDLGTSNSLVSFWDGEHVQLINNQFDQALTPSVVGVDDNGDILIGAIAKERLISHPQLTAATFKRFMGTDKKYDLGGHSFTPVELSSLVLRSLKEDAEAFLKQTCNEVVISVPAYFNNIQREATIEAAKLAGLTVQNLISEPTAAAMAYGFHKEADQSILVVDLGGGTFDVSLLEMFDGVMQVEAIAGDNHLGGEDFTHVIVQDCLREHKLTGTVLAATIQSVLYQKAELLKLTLTTQDVCSFDFDWEDHTYSYTLTQERYKELCEPLLAKMRQPVGRVLNDGHINIQEIDQVILIGGATKNPIVRNYFARLLKTIPYTQINPDEAVGRGAGIQAALKQDRSMVSEMILTDVCGHTLGVDSVSQTSTGYIDGVFSPIIERNTTIPVSKMKTFYTLRDNQEYVAFSIYQGENPMAKDNLKIGELEIKIPKGPENTPIDCRFTYDSNGLLEVIVTDLSGRSKQLIIESAPGKLTSQQMKESLAKLNSLKVHPRDRAENRLLLARLERLYAETTGMQREQVQALLFHFRDVLEKQEEILTKRTAAELTQQLNELEKGLWL
ncbi:molecular chaperone HscC [Enterococcus silesiacus]|uniref:Chaperone protein DnaK n=1 Tax=Enterococcus silesiacus TaxID=332949 RepID=A0A0S3KDD5_9ENTE|nr:molecular chaperone HscC [Enterococcus silesiacus]ALS02242.1 molecular chaperone HscC [Enterococcus silesiacus]OJG92401.1 hypothetical protein RV15_GL003194 [Enterococcus silesiacus]